MDYRQRKIAYNKMQGSAYFEADQALLKTKHPQNRFASISASSDKAKEKHQREILWALLLLNVSVDEIEANRKELGAGDKKVFTEEEQNLEIVKNGIAFIANVNKTLPPDSSEETMGVYRNTLATIALLPEESREELTKQLHEVICKFVACFTGKLVSVIEKADTNATIKCLIEEYDSLVVLVSKEAQETMRVLLNAKNPIPVKVQVLKGIDFTDTTTDNNLINELFKFFGLTATDGKKLSKMAALKAYRETLPVEIEGTEGETTGNGEGERIIIPETEELEEVKEQLEEKEEENQELQEQNEDLQNKVDELEEDLEAQKKSSENPS